jgi:hypothetical protein
LILAGRYCPGHGAKIAKIILLYKQKICMAGIREPHTFGMVGTNFAMGKERGKNATVQK